MLIKPGSVLILREVLFASKYEKNQLTRLAEKIVLKCDVDADIKYESCCLD
jgi:hypothetical protein